MGTGYKTLLALIVTFVHSAETLLGPGGGDAKKAEVWDAVEAAAVLGITAVEQHNPEMAGRIDQVITAVAGALYPKGTTVQVVTPLTTIINAPQPGTAGGITP
jgi:hypothetical protein